MRYPKKFLVAVIAALWLGGCGASEAQEKNIRQSDQFYEAGSIAWFEEGNALAAIRNLTRAVESNPRNDEAQYLLGIIRLGRGEYEAAEEHLSLVLEIRTEKNDTAGLAGARNNIGVLYVQQKRYEEAITVLKASAEEVMNREPWLAFGNLGWAYIEMGEYDKAIEALRRAMFDQPQYCVGLYRLGQAFYMKQEYKSALAHLTRAVEIEAEGCNRIQEAHHLIGMSNLRLGQNQGAQSAFQTCLEISPVTPVGAECQSALDSL